MEGFEQTSTAVHARLLDRATGAVMPIQTPTLIGADGLRSTVTDTCRHASGGDVEVLNARPSLTPSPADRRTRQQ
jgi:2-polyprenyl-6-methoxyphenol hydroxylase-like FAD-dependent oxidoreductase